MLYLTAGLADVGEAPDTEMESAVVKEFAVIASDYVTKHCMRLLGAQVNVADSEWGAYIAENQVSFSSGLFLLTIKLWIVS
jgi:hypothetical protein